MTKHYQLLNEIANGSTTSLEKLYKDFKARVFNTALSFLRNREDAEEITQDVFVEIFQSAKKFKGDSSVSTWIYRITVNKSLDKLRFRQRKKRFAFVVDIFTKSSGELKHDAAHFEHPGVALENAETITVYSLPPSVSR